MSVTGNGGRAAAGVVDALKGNPAMLTLLVSNIVLLVFLFYTETRASTQRKEITQMVFEHCIKGK
jgi:hypothetical protein